MNIVESFVSFRFYDFLNVLAIIQEAATEQIFV